MNFFRPLRVETLEDRLAPAILIVNSLDDLPLSLGDTNVTLRDAIFAANNDLPIFPNGPAGSGADEIQFQPDLGGTILLTQGQLTISSDLTITGPGASLLAISGNNASPSRVFNVDDGKGTYSSVTLSGLTVTGGMASKSDGGGIANRENLTVQNSVLSGNTATPDGFNNGNGGGIFDYRGTLTVQNSTISGNTAKYGGGIFVEGTVTVQNSTVSGNHAASGGGIENADTLTVQNSTVSGNTAGGHDAGRISPGGGIDSFGSLTVQNSTITQNRSNNYDIGGGVGGGIRIEAGTATLHNNIVASNFTGSGNGTSDDVNGAVDGSSRSNLIGVSTGLSGISNGPGGNQIGTAASPIDPKLALFATNGGLTATHALLAGSPAINTGSNAQAQAAGLTTDQRGSPFVRIANGAVDIGAYEVQTLSIGLVVDSTTDVNDRNYATGNLSLREAIYLANGSVGPDTITFSATVFATPQTITLGGTELRITDDLTLTGPGAGLLTVTGNNGSRVFNVDDGTSALRPVTLSGLTATGGKASPQSGGGILNLEILTVQNSTLSGNVAAFGGGIYNSGLLTVQNSTLSGSTATFDGGGIFNYGTLTVRNSTLSGNTATQDGGGIYNAGSGTLTLQNSTLSGNTADTNGGGIKDASTGILTVQNSTLSGNTATGQGGGIFIETSSGLVTVENSTLSGNKANSSGGGILNRSTLNVRNSTLTQNHADNDDNGGIGGGIRTAGTATLHNTIVADNFAGGGTTTRDDVTGAVAGSSTNNLIGVNTGLTGISNGTGGNQIGTAASRIDPLLGPLAENGGTTPTCPLLAGSPAIDKGNNAQASGTTDQRGSPFARIANGLVDIGAYEVQTLSIPLIVDTTADEYDFDYSAGDLSLREAIGLANGSVGANTITFSAGVFTTPQTITLGGTELRITDDLTITGPGASLLAVSGNNASRVFNVDDGSPTALAVTLSGLSVTGGKASNANGGGIANGENLTVQSSTLSGNTATRIDPSFGFGGGIFNDRGTLTVQNSTLSGNSAGGSGGGIFSEGLGSVTVQTSTLSGNLAKAGGGIDAAGPTLTVQNSTLSGNKATAGSGGGIQTLATNFTVQNSTLSGNTAAVNGGGIAAFNGLTVQNSTITQNHADNDDMGGELGGGIFLLNVAHTLHNTIVADNFTGSGTTTHDDVHGSVLAGSTSNLIGVDSGLTGISNGDNGNQVGTAAVPIDPRLGSLANNGGPTLTHALCTGPGTPGASCTAASPALNTGSNAVIPADTFDLDGDGNTAEPIPFDQRGSPFSRIFNTTVDIGSFEVAPNHAPTCTIGPPQNTTDESGPQSVLGWVANCLPNDPGQTVTVSLMVDKPELFTAGPAVDASGKLTYTPAPNVHGTAIVTVTVKDDGGTANSGVDSSSTMIAFVITKPHPFHNSSGDNAGITNLLASDVTNTAGNGLPDRRISTADALAVISLLNQKGLNRNLPSTNSTGGILATFGGAPLAGGGFAPFVDVRGTTSDLPDNFLSAADALAIIDHLNARQTGTGEGESVAVATDSSSTAPALAPPNDTSMANLIALLASDTATEQFRRRRANQ